MIECRKYVTYGRLNPAWYMVFTITSGCVSFKYNVEEPYRHSLDSWYKLVSCCEDMRLKYYQNDACHNSGLGVENGYFRFGVVSVGTAGGEVASVITVPAAAVANKLELALNTAVKEGYTFAGWGGL